ncbi:MAG: AlwI family type II restriction endonuclease [Syntrophomonadaceae bacterium]|nr:AlwI family type II restriction endonuclease [Syntrophomonadaceae bacterium]
MKNENISYQSFCWVVGTTSFRTAKLNLKIEQQLLLLNEFYDKRMQEYNEWIWNDETQSLYYDFMKEKKFLTGNAQRKAKDAREKTSGLFDIGLINKDRTISEAGKDLLKVTELGNYKADNFFNIDKDSYIFLKQLLKTSINVGASTVRPYYVLAKFLTELEYLTYEEFTYLLPMGVDDESVQNIIRQIKINRGQNNYYIDIIYENLINKKNYKLAYNSFINNPISEELLCSVGMNRKSKNYDKSYYSLFINIIDVFINKNKKKVYDMFESTKKLTSTIGVLWRRLLFTTTYSASIKKLGFQAIREDCVFINCKTEKEIKNMLFKYLHSFKAMVTLADYFDLNRRYFNLSDTLVFEDNLVKFDLLPKYFFKECIDSLYLDTFTENTYLFDSVTMLQISASLAFDKDIIYHKVSQDSGLKIENPEQAAVFIRDERYRRFNKLIDLRFSDEILLELLVCFETRNDSRIEEIITDEATIPTMFEYVLGIIWYKVSERQGNILEYMKLSLEPNLLPKSHAAGGSADIIYEYLACDDYPAHSLLIEVTLTDGTNQRRMEMEPVSRHLGEYMLISNNPFDYTLFISTFLHINVIADFRSRRNAYYYGEGGSFVEGMKIIPLNTGLIKDIIKHKMNYRYLYKLFDEMHISEIRPPNWQNRLTKELSQGYYSY